MEACRGKHVEGRGNKRDHAKAGNEKRRGMSKGRSKGGGMRPMQQGTRRSPWRPRVFPSHMFPSHGALTALSAIVSAAASSIMGR